MAPITLQGSKIVEIPAVGIALQQNKESPPNGKVSISFLLLLSKVGSFSMDKSLEAVSLWNSSRKIAMYKNCT